MGSELRCQNFDLVKFRQKFRETLVMRPFFVGTLSQNPQKVLICRLSPNLGQNFGQILTRARGLNPWSELHLEVVWPRFEEINGRKRGRQQTLAFRYRRRSPTELGYRGECPT